jgi:hypothetical protein
VVVYLRYAADMSSTRNTVEAHAVARARGIGRSALRNRQGGSDDDETTARCRMGSTRRQADNLTVGRLELIASDLLRGAAPGSFVLSDSSNLPSPFNRFVGRHFGANGTSATARYGAAGHADRRCGSR